MSAGDGLLLNAEFPDPRERFEFVIREGVPSTSAGRPERGTVVRAGDSPGGALR